MKQPNKNCNRSHGIIHIRVVLIPTRKVLPNRLLINICLASVCYFVCIYCRIERVHLNRKDGKPKVLGTLASVAGASVITVKGHYLWTSKSFTFKPIHIRRCQGAELDLGLRLCYRSLTMYVGLASWIVIQAPVLKKYPARFSVTSFTLLFGILQFLAVAAYVERDFEAWHVHSGSEAFAILYTVCFLAQTNILIHTSNAREFIF